MKRALLILCCATVSGCFPFDDTVDDLCRSGRFPCPVDAGEPTGPDGGPGEDGGTGDDGGTPDGGDGDGGIPDGGTPSMSDGGLAGACKASWCWEHPRPIGSPTLWTVWGRSDDDLWAGGAGGLLLHFDGSSWRTEPVSETLLWNSVVHSGFTIPGGESWLCASLHPPMTLTGAGLPSWNGSNACGGADWWNGESYFINNGDGPVVRSPSGPLDAIIGGPSVYGRKLVRAGTNGVMLGESSSSPDGLFIDWYRPGETTGRRDLVLAPDGGNLSFITSIRRGPDDELWLLGSVGSRTVFGKLTDAGLTVDLLPEPQLVLMDFGYAEDAGWWFVGDNTYFARTNDPMTLPPDTSSRYQSINATWRSPQGTLWAVGEAALVTRDGLAITPYIQDPVFDIVTSEPVIAVGGASGSTGNILRRGDAGTWAVVQNTADAIIGVSRMRDGGLVTFDVGGNVREGALPLSAGTTSNFGRASMAVDPNDGIWLATPDQVRFWGADKQLHSAPAPVGLVFSDLTLAPDGGVLVTLNDPGGSEGVGGLATVQPDGGLDWLVQGKRLNTVASWSTGFAAVSANVVQSCSFACVDLTQTPGGSPGSLVAFSASDMYLAHSDGSVYHFTGANWVNVSPPLGSDGNPFLVGRLRASPDGKSLYLVGDDGAILRRSLP